MSPLEIGRALQSAGATDPVRLSELLVEAGSDIGATDVVIYLVDFSCSTLEPLPNNQAHRDLPQSEPVVGSMAGRSFAERSLITAERLDGLRVWTPIVEGTDRTGVLALTVPGTSHEILQTCEELGVLAGYLIATHTRATDLYSLHRRRRSLSLAASMQWDLLPPLILKSELLSVAGMLEPAYEVAGDCFDYALNGTKLSLAIFDPIGHGVSSALTAALCLGSYRHDRREGVALSRMHTHLDRLLAEHLDPVFVTGQMVQIDVESGVLTWTNAGHPLPLLIRHGHVVEELFCAPTLPWGIGHLAVKPNVVQVATEALEPGDRVMFYTDGVVEAHAVGGEQYGAQRLVDLIGQHASDLLDPEEVVRHLLQSVQSHRGGGLADDATLVLVEWTGKTPSRS